MKTLILLIVSIMLALVGVVMLVVSTSKRTGSCDAECAKEADMLRNVGIGLLVPGVLGVSIASYLLYGQASRRAFAREQYRRLS